MRDCPIFQAEVIYEGGAEFFVAAETIEEARTIAGQLACSEARDWASNLDYEVNLRAVDNPHPRAVHEYGGVFVQGLNGGKGDWVETVDDVPQLPPLPDPNQGVFGFEAAGGQVRQETIEVPGGEL